MRFVRRYSAAVLFVAVLIFCAVKVIGQFQANEARHVEMRENFLLLYESGHVAESDFFLQRLIYVLPEQADKVLFDDYQRVATIVSTNIQSIDDPLYRYRASLNEQIKKRSSARLERALKQVNENR
jgi:hypothetical protein